MTKGFLLLRWHCWKPSRPQTYIDQINYSSQPRLWIIINNENNKGNNNNNKNSKNSASNNKRSSHKNKSTGVSVMPISNRRECITYACL